MAFNTSQRHIIEERRREVAVLRRRRYTFAQIAEALAKAGRVNPRTGKAWTDPTIKADVDFLQAEARKEALKDTLEHRAEILSDYQEIIKQAWRKKPPDYRLILKAYEGMRKMLGTDEPEVIVFGQVRDHVFNLLDILQDEFRNEPDICARIVARLLGGIGEGVGATKEARAVN